MISRPNGTMTWSSLDGRFIEVHSVLRTPHYSSMIDRYQDDGFGEPFDTDPLPGETNQVALDITLEDLH